MGEGRRRPVVNTTGHTTRTFEGGHEYGTDAARSEEQEQQQEEQDISSISRIAGAGQYGAALLGAELLVELFELARDVEADGSLDDLLGRRVEQRGRREQSRHEVREAQLQQLGLHGLEHREAESRQHTEAIGEANVDDTHRVLVRQNICEHSLEPLWQVHDRIEAFFRLLDAEFVCNAR